MEPHRRLPLVGNNVPGMDELEHASYDAHGPKTLSSGTKYIENLAYLVHVHHAGPALDWIRAYVVAVLVDGNKSSRLLFSCGKAEKRFPFGRESCSLLLEIRLRLLEGHQLRCTLLVLYHSCHLRLEGGRSLRQV